MQHQEVRVSMVEAKIQPTRGSIAYSYHHGTSNQHIDVAVLQLLIHRNLMEVTELGGDSLSVLILT
jgi:hypothetical protein